MAELISGATVTGQDQWTNEIISATTGLKNTSLPDDPTISAGQGIVQ